jgi:hypothetical protein
VRFARVALALLGGAAIAWAVGVLPVFRFAVPVRDVAEGIMANQRFKPGALNDVRTHLAARPASAFTHPALSRSEALVLLQTAEEVTDRQGSGASDRAMDAAEAAVKVSLALNPRDSFLWLMLYSLETTRSGFDPGHIRLLDQSYATGPREGWIALRRNRLALAAFQLLDAEVQDKVVEEFAGLVVADFLDDAESNLAGVGWPQRERLLASLARVDVISREAFARRLSRDAIKTDVPGVTLDERLWR